MFKAYVETAWWLVARPDCNQSCGLFVGISYATTCVGISYAIIGLEDQVVIA